MKEGNQKVLVNNKDYSLEQMIAFLDDDDLYD